MLLLEIRSDLILYYPVTAGQSAAHPQHDLLCDWRIEDSGRLLPIIIAIAHLNGAFPFVTWATGHEQDSRSEEHTSELQSPMRISSAVLCLAKPPVCNDVVTQKH